MTTPTYGGDLGEVADQSFTIPDFRLSNGATLQEATIAYETYGKLAPHGTNAVLITHGYTASHHAAGRNPKNNRKPTAREAVIREAASAWAKNWDAHSLIILRRALLGFDTKPDFAKITAKVLYVLCRSDELFPPAIAPPIMQALAAAGVEAQYFELDSDLGHSSSGPDHAKWSPVLRDFLRSLERQR